jgi:hypothetical protein
MAFSAIHLRFEDKARVIKPGSLKTTMLSAGRLTALLRDDAA